MVDIQGKAALNVPLATGLRASRSTLIAVGLIDILPKERMEDAEDPLAKKRTIS